MKRRAFLVSAGAGLLAGCTTNSTTTTSSTRNSKVSRTTSSSSEEPKGQESKYPHLNSLDSASEYDISWQYSDLVRHVSRDASVHTVGSNIVIGDSGSNVHVVDAKTGQRDWYVEPPSPGKFLGVSNDVVATGGNTGDIGVYSLSDGSEKWTAQHKSQIHKICVADDKVHILSGTEEKFGGFDVSALDVNTGDLLWEKNFSGINIDFSENGTFVVSGMVGRLEEDPRPHEGRVICANPDGTVKWQAKTNPDVNPRNPVITKSGEVYVSVNPIYSEQGGIIAFDETGTRKWTKLYDGGPQDEYWTVHHKPTVTQEGILAILDPEFSNSPTRRLILFDKGDGTELQSVQLPPKTPSGFAPATSGGEGYILTTIPQNETPYFATIGFELADLTKATNYSIISEYSSLTFKSPPVITETPSTLAFSADETLYGIDISGK